MPELPGSRVDEVGPNGSAGALPLGGELESAAASESQAPDPAWIASIAKCSVQGIADRRPHRARRKPAVGASLRRRCTRRAVFRTRPTPHPHLAEPYAGDERLPEDTARASQRRTCTPMSR